jgi:deoxyribodipyrimidine photolyase
MLSTKLSPWLANGALSPKMVAKEINKEAKLGMRAP